MQHRRFSMNLNSKLALLLISSLMLSGCAMFNRAPKERIVTQIQTVERSIPIQGRPKGLDLHEVSWYVVTAENFEEFREKFIHDNGNFVFYAISVPTYENMALNLADIKRYIGQQQALIVYYEEQAKPSEPVTTTENSEDSGS